VNTDAILDIFDKEGLKIYDYVEYSGDKLTVTRNPFGFINTKKRGTLKGTTQKKKLGGANKRSQKQLGGGDAFDRYDGIKFDDTGNISDNLFVTLIIRILRKYGIEVQEGNIELRRHKALPDDADAFLSSFVDVETESVKNMDLFRRRILGLTSYYRSVQEKLFPNFAKTSTGDDYHVVKAEMSDHQFDIYKRIRHVEATKESASKSRKRFAAGDDIFNVSSTYRVFSRAACNFTFPDEIKRPMPNEGEKEIGENDFDAVPKEFREENDAYIDAEDVDSEEVDTSYAGRIQKALEDIASVEVKQYLKPASLRELSPKFVKVLENLSSEENMGLHLIYSHFRTIEGIGILRLILLANGFAEFKLVKVDSDWQIKPESEEDEAKPHFVLYTGTEEDEEKEIIRNIYNSAWDLVPTEISARLRERSENNHLGEVIKIFMITSSGAEGINLKNTRFVHIIEPYWHMVRVEQVIGRARRICSHQDLPEEMRNVKVYLYVTTFSEKQKTDTKNNKELISRDKSKQDKITPVTTDETLYEIASKKQRINGQILRAVKESSVDCTLYSSTNNENLVCFDFGKTTSNIFGSYPSFDQDRDTPIQLETKLIEWEARFLKDHRTNIEYALNPNTNELYDAESYRRYKEHGVPPPRLVGRIEKKGRGYMFMIY
jgi:hypothetical protein